MKVDQLVQPVEESFIDFNRRCDQARILQQKSIEASDYIASQIVPGGFGEQLLINYRGLSVYPIGKTQEHMNKMNVSMERKLHGL